MVEIQGSGACTGCGGANRVHYVAHGQQYEAEETVEKSGTVSTEQVGKKICLWVGKEPVPIKRARCDYKNAGT
jgi:hypothetical protein